MSVELAVREKAAVGLAWRRDSRIGPALIEAAADPDPAVRETFPNGETATDDSRRRIATVELNAQKMEDFQRKFYIFLVVLGIAFLLLSVRLWQLQVIKGSDYRRLSENNRIRLLNTRADRGMLLDQKGEILAHNRPSFEVFAVPEHLKGNPEVLTAVGQILNIPPADIQEKMPESETTGSVPTGEDLDGH